MINKEKSLENGPVRIQGLSHEGRGVSTLNNKKVFVTGALPEELVSFKLLKKRRRYNEAEVLEVIEPSPQRVPPPCLHFNVCGGCSLQHMKMNAQIQLKQESLINQFAHFGKVAPLEIIKPLSANLVGYRRKARLGVRYVIKKEKLFVGFREKNGRYLADLQECIILPKDIGLKLSTLATLITSLEGYQEIPQIEVAIGDRETALVFRHMIDLSNEDMTKLIHFGQTSQFHIYLQPNPPAPIQKIWPSCSEHRLSYTLPEYGLELFFHPLDFIQINLELNRLMIKQALAFLELDRQDNVLDLFCGLGNFTLPIATQARSVVGIEGSNEMVKRAKINAQHNHIQNTEFYAADLMSSARSIYDNVWQKIQYHKLLLDPPRAGAQAILPNLKQFKPHKIVYVSCNPATLARDAGEIVHQHGYQLTHAGIMNMFPHTTHIEAMAVFEK